MVSLLGSGKRTELEFWTKFLCFSAACQLGNSTRSGTLITMCVCRDHIDHVLFFFFFTNMKNEKQHR